MTRALPDTMKAVEITGKGGPEVLVKVAAAGVNRPDVMQRQGNYPPPPGITDIPGLEIAGTVAALGAGVSGWRVGDELCALVAGGGYAEYCAAPAPQCLKVPAGLGVVEAAALPETFFTVWDNLFTSGKLQAGETVLVHGGASGIGTTAIQLASAKGAVVIVTAGTAEKCAACEALGASRAINYNDEDFVDVVKQVTDGEGVNVVLDMIGGDYVTRNLNALAVDGRLVQIAIQHGTKAQIVMHLIMTKRLTVTGSTLRARPVAAKGAIARALRENVWPLIEAGRVKPEIFATFSLEKAMDAHALMDSGAHIGKIVLTV